MAEAARHLRFSVSGTFRDWLAAAGGAVAITTYQAGRVVLVGCHRGRVSVLPRQFPKPMGIAARQGEMAVACRDEVLFLADAPGLAPHYPAEGSWQYDAIFLPRARYRTGALDAHEIAYGTEGLWVVNTRFSCLCLLSRKFSFEPRWRPAFVSALAAEDRCHLNGIALRDGEPRYVTALGRTDTPGGWREGKMSGGVLIDVEAGEVVMAGLCMPHSPRWAAGAWWLLNSGRGELCLVEPDRGRHEVVARVGGYLRGLCFAGDYALIGASKIRSSHALEGLPVAETFDRLFCGIAVVDLRSGTEVGRLIFDEGCDELFDVAFLPGAVRPSILNWDSPLARQLVACPDFSCRLDGGEAHD